MSSAVYKLIKTPRSWPHILPPLADNEWAFLRAEVSLNWGITAPPLPIAPLVPALSGQHMATSTLPIPASWLCLPFLMLQGSPLVGLQDRTRGGNSYLPEAIRCQALPVTITALIRQTDELKGLTQDPLPLLVPLHLPYELHATLRISPQGT